MFGVGRSMFGVRLAPATPGESGLDKPFPHRCCHRFSKQESLRKLPVMALKIRLTRIGTTHQPHYRFVIAEARSRRDGDPVEVVGIYDPRLKGETVKLKLDRVEYWLGKGAKPTDTVHAMIKKARRAAAPA